MNAKWNDIKKKFDEEKINKYQMICMSPSVGLNNGWAVTSSLTIIYTMI